MEEGGVEDSFIVVVVVAAAAARETPLPPPEAPVGTNSLAKGFGWNPGPSLRVVAGEDVRDSGREGSLEVDDICGGGGG